MSKVYQLTAHPRLTVEEALALATRAELTDVIVLGYRKREDGKQNFYSVNSAMTRAEAVWLLMDGIDWARGADEDE